MDILPRVKNGEFAFYPHRKLVGLTSARLMAVAGARMQYLTSADADAAMQVAYNFVAAKHLGCLRVVLFHNAVTQAGRRFIDMLQVAGLVGIDKKAGRADVMVISDTANDTLTDAADNVSVPNVRIRPAVVVRDRATGRPAAKVDGARHTALSDDVRLINTWTESIRVVYTPTWSKIAVQITPDSLRYTRIYLDDFRKYGRYTALFQSLSKIDRATIKINGTPTCELDFTAMHPSLIYAEENLRRPDDMYGFCTHVPREWRKLALLISINAKTKDAAVVALASRIGSTSGYAAGLLDAARAYHKPVAHWFCSDAGVYLMHRESSIASGVLHDCRVHNIPVLCMHDGFICRRYDEARVAEIMRESFRDYMGETCAVSRKGV